MSMSALLPLPQLSFAAGHVVISEGQPLRGIYFLEQGELEVLKNGVTIAEIFEPGAVLGEMSWLLGTTPTATVRTITPCTFRHVADPSHFVREHSEVALHVAVILARRLDSLNRYLVDIKRQFGDRADHLGILDEVLDALMNKHPRDIPRRATGD